MNNIVKSKGINFGIYFGLFLIGMVLYGYVIDLEFFVSFWYLGILIVGFIVNSFWVVGSTKKALGGYLTFKEGFSSYFLSVLIALLLSTLLTIIIFNFVDPEVSETIKQLSIEKTRIWMEDFGAQSSQIDEQIDKIKNADNFSIVSQIKGFFVSLAVASVYGLLPALIVKRKKED